MGIQKKGDERLGVINPIDDLLGDFYVLGTILSALHKLSHFNLTKKLCDEY